LRRAAGNELVAHQESGASENVQPDKIPRIPASARRPRDKLIMELCATREEDRRRLSRDSQRGGAFPTSALLRLCSFVDAAIDARIRASTLVGDLRHRFFAFDLILIPARNYPRN